MSKTPVLKNTPMIVNPVGNSLVKRAFLLFDPHRSHRLMERSLSYLDRHPRCLESVLHAGFGCQAVAGIHVGAVDLPSPLMVAAGLVKGHGFASQDDALRAVAQGRNIIPGWRTVPALAGPVEFGSFTPQPRMGNPQPNLWRDRRAGTLYNSVGLRNPGMAAACAFLSERADQLPPSWGLSLAPDPLEPDRHRRLDTLAAAARTLVESGVAPSWVTLNLSCPNVEFEAADQPPPDPHSPDEARRMCLALRRELPSNIPVWAKAAPGLSQSAYGELAHALSQAGAAAIIATNTLPREVPRQSSTATAHRAGMSGTYLLPSSLAAAKTLVQACRTLPLDVIGCGGITNGESFRAYQSIGIQAAQYWSALVFRGPLAAELIYQEARA